MPPKTNEKAAAGMPTQRELEMIFAAFQCLKGKTDIDFDLLASKTGLAVGSTRNAWYNIRKKWLSDASGAAATSAGEGSKSAARTPTKRKSTAVADDDDTPTKRRTTTRHRPAAKGKGKAVATADDDADDDMADVKQEDDIMDDDDEDEDPSAGFQLKDYIKMKDEK